MINDKKTKNQFNTNTGSDQLFDNLIWLNSKEAATYLRRSVGQLRNMVYRGQIKAKKHLGKLYFKRRELYELIETSSY